MLSQREERYIKFIFNIKDFWIKKLRMCILKSEGSSLMHYGIVSALAVRSARAQTIP